MSIYLFDMYRPSSMCCFSTYVEIVQLISCGWIFFGDAMAETKHIWYLSVRHYFTLINRVANFFCVCLLFETISLVKTWSRLISNMKYENVMNQAYWAVCWKTVETKENTKALVFFGKPVLNRWTPTTHVNTDLRVTERAKCALDLYHLNNLNILNCNMINPPWSSWKTCEQRLPSPPCLAAVTSISCRCVAQTEQCPAKTWHPLASCMQPLQKGCPS